MKVAVFGYRKMNFLHIFLQNAFSTYLAIDFWFLLMRASPLKEETKLMDKMNCVTSNTKQDFYKYVNICKYIIKPRARGRSEA